MKTCTICKTEKYISEFYKDSRKTDKLQSHCKICDKDKKLKRKTKLKPILIEKKCSRCNKIKPIKYFNKDTHTNSGYKTYCKECVKLYRQLLQNREKIEVEEKKCYTCKKIKTIENYTNCSANLDGKNGICKECSKISAKRGRQINWATQLINDSRKKDRKNNNIADITKKFLQNQLKVQNSLCYYCDCEMKFGKNFSRNCLDGLTLERIDSTSGHIKSNCVLICYECNIMKNNINFKKFIKKCLKIGKKFQYIINS